MNLFKKLISYLPADKVYAHCDVPCGIYDPKAAQIAAETVLKMTQKLTESHVPEGEDVADLEYTKHHNQVVRLIWTKEEHARKCKEEILILWTDYFKPEHLEKYPDLHDLIWKTAKLVSKTKQEVDLTAAEELVTNVNKIADIFLETKKS